MQNYTTTFPITIDTNKNPLIDFYEKVLASVGLEFGEEKADVTKFKVNSNDHKKLNEALIVHFTKQNPKSTSKKKIKEMASWSDLDIGPAVSTEISEGTVSFTY